MTCLETKFKVLRPSSKCKKRKSILNTAPKPIFAITYNIHKLNIAATKTSLYYSVNSAVKILFTHEFSLPKYQII